MSIFSTVFNRRNTYSAKWDMLEQVYSINNASEVLPMWVADMDFAIPSVIIEALQTRMEHPVFGYSMAPEETKSSLTKWVADKHQVTIQNEWIMFRQGVIPGIAEVIEAFTEVGDKVLIHTPVYPPFTTIPTNLGREVVTSQLIEMDNSYEMDWHSFEKCLKNDVKAFILCNPHNPGGKVWSKGDLTKMAALCQQYNVLVLSDEIHSDLIFEPNKHTPLLNVAEDPNNIITFFAPTKTFNLAGIQAAAMVVPDEQKRKVLENLAMSRGYMGLNIFSLTALQTAYEQGGPWLEELLEVLTVNMDYVIEHLSKLEGIKVSKPEGTYLVWIDYRGTGLSEKEMMDRLLTVGKLALEPGSKYGKAGEGFLRMNLACPLSTVQDGVERFKKSLE
ncbi:cystathione beta-lyase [Psychrobacillus psychrotolerans]|uniref:cysteine-S-conjugate beta-lyase n=1 Tax=Psychrobacillus psychrotolerans TaxID=126156 RepID=A0A1I6A412_9BACI|nr:MalY/PatB family protein [Psychrobacillus psychrotolerans]SFQ63451.1 cystathione beta-lyase [Psychrobacillus psychrotolerans]